MALKSPFSMVEPAFPSLQVIRPIPRKLPGLRWNHNLRCFGTVPNAEFGLGLERCVLFVTSMGRIRDVIPFPRTRAVAGALWRRRPKSAEF